MQNFSTLMITFVLVLSVVVLRMVKVNEAIKNENEKRQRRINEAKRIGRKDIVVCNTRRGIVYENVDTGEHYIRKITGPKHHLCYYDEFGHLERDLTQEGLVRDLGHERECAIKDGRRLYMVDNRSYNPSDNADPQSADDWFLAGVRYKDVVTGREYVIGEVEAPFGKYVVLVDTKTLLFYDVLKQKNGRGYLKNNTKIDRFRRREIEKNGQKKFAPFFGYSCLSNNCIYIDSFEEWIKCANWAILNYEFKDWRSKVNAVQNIIDCNNPFRHGYVIGITGCYESGTVTPYATDWSKMLDVDIRDEFKNEDTFPIAVCDRNPIKEFRNNKRKAKQERNQKKSIGRSVV